MKKHKTVKPQTRKTGWVGRFNMLLKSSGSREIALWKALHKLNIGKFVVLLKALHVQGHVLWISVFRGSTVLFNPALKPLRKVVFMELFKAYSTRSPNLPSLLFRINQAGTCLSTVFLQLPSEISFFVWLSKI